MLAPTQDEITPGSSLFLILAFVIAAGVGAAVIYLGVTGHIGAGVP